ncbi:hypothetical protein WCWAEYFT_CDS0229 [Vibrio phage VB_VaC_TDDLMA]
MKYYKLMNLFELGLCSRYEYRIQDLDLNTYEALHQYYLRHSYKYSEDRSQFGDGKIVVFIHGDLSRMEFFCNTVGDFSNYDEDLPIGLVGLDCYQDSINFRLINLVKAIIVLIDRPELMI